jgi:hypothetical protein
VVLRKPPTSSTAHAARTRCGAEQVGRNGLGTVAHPAQAVFASSSHGKGSLIHPPLACQQARRGFSSMPSMARARRSAVRQSGPTRAARWRTELSKITSTPDLLHTFRQIQRAIGFRRAAERNLFDIVQRLVGATLSKELSA